MSFIHPSIRLVLHHEMFYNSAFYNNNNNNAYLSFNVMCVGLVDDLLDGCGNEDVAVLE